MTETRSTTPVRGRPEGRRGGVGLFYRQVVAELRKVVWPSRQQLVTYFFVVLAFVVALMVIVSLLDLAFGKAMFQLFG